MRYRPSCARQRRGVDGECHAQHRLVDGQAGQRLRIGRVGERVSDLDFRETGDDEQVAGRRSSTSTRLIPLESEQLRQPPHQLRRALGRLLVEQRHVLAVRSVPATTLPMARRPR